MAVGRTVLRNFSVPGQSPAQVLAVANRVMAAQNEKNMFITLFYGHYHVRSRRTWCSPTADTRRPTLCGTMERWSGPDRPAGPLVGVLPDAEYGESNETLGPAKCWSFTPMGATEGHDQDGLLLGDDGLRQIIAAAGSRPVEDACRLVIERVAAPSAVRLRARQT